MALPDQQGGKSPIDRRFDLLRGKVEQEASAAKQQANEGLQRKAISQGMGGSGAFIKLGQQQDDALEAQKRNAVEGVEAQRETAIAEKDERDLNRAFAREERLGSQDFASQMAQKQMAFQSDEARAQRSFESSEAAVARGFQKQLFDKDMDFKKRVQGDAMKQFEKQFKLAGEQFKFDKEVSRFNMDMAEKMWNKKDLQESLMNTMGYDPRTGKSDRSARSVFGAGASGGPRGPSF